jgi:hypothetical protein
LLALTKKLVQEKGLDSTDIDAAINKQGIGGELKKSKDVKALVSFLKKIMNSSSNVKSNKEVS